MTRIAWSAALIVMILEASPTDAFGQSQACQTIQRGESATQAAQRLTGNGQNAYQEWFQIMNRSSKFGPKSQYDRIRDGWRACVLQPANQTLPSNARYVEAAPTAGVFEAPHVSRVPEVLAAQTPLVVPRLAGDNLSMLWLCVVIVVSWSGWWIADSHLARRQTASIVVQSFVDRFVDEFARPLVRYDAGERPVRSRLRLRARRSRFDILLAPREGGRYPNLSDHRKNVEYDVARVMDALADASFASGAPYTEAEWIVVPFKFTADRKRSDVTCISSL